MNDDRNCWWNLLLPSFCTVYLKNRYKQNNITAYMALKKKHD